jgi:hypothetical protein
MTRGREGLERVGQVHRQQRGRPVVAVGVAVALDDEVLPRVGLEPGVALLPDRRDPLGALDRQLAGDHAPGGHEVADAQGAVAELLERLDDVAAGEVLVRGGALGVGFKLRQDMAGEAGVRAEPLRDALGEEAVTVGAHPERPVVVKPSLDGVEVVEVQRRETQVRLAVDRRRGPVAHRLVPDDRAARPVQLVVERRAVAGVGQPLPRPGRDTKSCLFL